MRIVLLPSAYAPAVGGVEELTAKLAQRLLAAGDAVEVWTIRHPAELPADEQIDGVRVRRFAMPLPRLAPVALAGFPRQAARAARPLVEAAAEFRPDLLHVQCFSANGVYATWLARKLDVPVVVSLQGETVMDDADVYEHSLTLRLGLRAGLRRADAVTGCSRFVLDDAERRFGLRPGKGDVVPNGVELDEPAVPAPLVLPFERFVLGLGRIVEKKGFDLLLAAFARLAPRHPELGLVIGGDGAARQGLLDAARAAGLEERVALPGALSRGQVAWATAAASAFVLPSRVEPFGIVVLEALRAGCPVVATPRGGATDIVRDGIDGLVVDPLDADALARAVERLLTDEGLARRLRAAGPRRAAAFGWSELAPRYRAVYDDAIAGRGQNRAS
ncbi:MAG TPA: glycosyltransferase family 4 protein [Gaiellaceae bacterium]|jgi:glycosyltransferase involved in cell wall biosynthesis|nr:glycosyltransferase family 4 protein [Gaiellaceae bacterium]